MEEPNKVGKYKSKKIELFPTLSKNVGSLYLNENYADVVFKVADEKIPANKAILAVSSEYFRGLLFGSLEESNQDEIALTRIEVQPFKLLLKYIYTGVVEPIEDESDLVDIISMAHMYQLVELEKILSDDLCSNLTIENVIGVINRAQFRIMDVVFQNCCTFIYLNSQEVLKHESFLSLLPECLEVLLSRAAFFESEIEIFKRVLKWYDVNQEKVKHWPQLLRNCVQFSNISLEDHVKVVQPTQLLTCEEIMSFMQENQNGNRLFRGKLLDNLETVSGNKNYDSSRALTITLESNHPWFINYICLRHIILQSSHLLSQIVQIGKGYKVSISCDGKNWKTIVNYQAFSWDICRDQDLYFEAQPVFYVKINVADSFALSGTLYLPSLSATYTTPPKLISDVLLCPGDSVTMQSYSRLCTTASNQSNSNILLNQKNAMLDKIQYTAQTIGQELYPGIIVILKQPYMISKIRLLLKNVNDNYYHYYIELSTNNTDWEMVYDKRTEEARSWQEVTFPIRPVVLIKIVGTHSSMNNLFECANLQCYSE